MPIYVYQYLNDDGTAGETFEYLQSIRDDALIVHPENGRPVRRVITAAGINCKSSSGKIEADLSDKNLDRLGFTKYVKSKDGYKKAVGSGPERLTPGQD
ncbi:MAG: FmdB family transcriptional regulator [Planctomycetaceae bacterium]|nr:FmdB family transcriptional regulator [Planctomycetaceae bacterium]